MASEESASATQRVGLSSKWFQAALDRYIDDNKPDPLSRKQLEGWSLKWVDDEDDGDDSSGLIETNDDKDGGNNTNDFLPDPSHKVHGTLEIGGEYLVVILHVTCLWKAEVVESQGGASSSSTQFGRFFFSCHATVRFWTKSELKENHDESGTDRVDRKVQDKIRSKMVARLRDDAYISKLFVEKKNKNSSSPQSTDVPVGQLLAEAKIKYSAGDLEERVSVSEDVCEAIKRAVWSSAESPLDVVEIILQLPFLPTPEHKLVEAGSTIATTPLANRAKLRILEDAMCDACEKEGEGEMLDDLMISNVDATKASDVQQGGDDEDPSWEAATSKKKKGHRESRKKTRSN